MEFELGQTYSGYKFLDVVTRSRGAVQYRVQNTLAQRVESLRTPAAAAGDDPDAAERFLREVRIRARLSHPHIVTFYTALPIEGRMAMTTELADWLPLSQGLNPGPNPSTSPASCWKLSPAFTSSPLCTATSRPGTSCWALAASANWPISPWPVRSVPPASPNPARWWATPAIFLPSRSRAREISIIAATSIRPAWFSTRCSAAVRPSSRAAISNS